MSETPAADSLVQRVAIGRLTGPGILDRRAMQRTYDRFAPSARLQALDRLYRRITPASATTESLPLVRVDRSIDRSIDPSVAATAESSRGASAPLAGDHAVAAAAVSAATPGASGSSVGGLVARQALTVSRPGAFVARRIASTPGLIAGNSAASGVLKNAQHHGDVSGGQSAMAISATSMGTLQRMPDRVATSDASAGAQAVASTLGSSGAGATSTVMRAASQNQAAAASSSTGARDGLPTPAERPRGAALSTTRADALTVQRKADLVVRTSAVGSPRAPLASAAPPAHATTGDVSRSTTTISSAPQSIAKMPPLSSAGEPGAPSIAVVAGALPHVSAGNSGTAMPPVLQRKSNATVPIPAVRALASATTSPSGAAAPTQLVLRKAVVGREVNQGPMQPPSITPLPSQIITRTADERHAAPHARTSPSSSDWNIDWITEQVGRRLARRLEIERERMGVRSWR